MLYIITFAAYRLAFVFMSLAGWSVYQDFEVRILPGGSGVAGEKDLAVTVTAAEIFPLAPLLSLHHKHLGPHL